MHISPASNCFSSFNEMTDGRFTDRRNRTGSTNGTLRGHHIGRRRQRSSGGVRPSQSTISAHRGNGYVLPLGATQRRSTPLTSAASFSRTTHLCSGTSPSCHGIGRMETVEDVLGFLRSGKHSPVFPRLRSSAIMVTNGPSRIS